MTRSIAITVRTSAEGLEMIESLSRQGFPAVLVSRPFGLHVEIPARRDGILPLPARPEPDHAEPPLRAA